MQFAEASVDIVRLLPRIVRLDDEVGRLGSMIATIEYGLMENFGQQGEKRGGGDAERGFR